MREFSPLMLTIARESRKKSQTALAQEVGITQSAISQMESGLISPSEKVARDLARALGYRAPLLYESVAFKQLPITFFRKKARLGVRDVNAIRARVNLFRLRIAALLRSYPLDEPTIALANLASEGLAPADAAHRLRIYWNVPPGPIRDLTALMESSGIVVVPMDFGTSAVDGLSIYEPTDVLPPMIFLNPAVPPDRWRLTLGHEAAHIVMHHHLKIPPEAKDMESEAYEFAVELLAPFAEIGGQLSRLSMHRLAALKKHWGVSMAALLKLAQDRGRVSPSEARRYWIQLGKGGRQEPVQIDPERPKTLTAMVKYHVDALGYTVQDLSDILYLNPDELRADFGLSPAPLRLA